MGDQMTVPMSIPGNSTAEAASATMQPAAQGSQSSIAGILKVIQEMMSNQGGLPKGISPTSMQSTIPTPQAPQAPVQASGGQIPQGSFQTSGERKRAESQSMLNNIAEFTNKATAYVHEKKVRAMQADVERVLTAFTGMQQAQASGDQAALKQNQQILNDLFSDPKKVKSFEKAFSVKLLGDDKGKATPEHQGLMKAIADFKKSGGQGLNPIAQKFQNSMPVQQGMNPQLAAVAQLIKAKILPEANEQVKAQTESMKQVSETLRAGFNAESKEKIAGMLVDSKDRATNSAILRTIMQEHGRLGAAEILGRAQVQRANIMAGAMRDSAQWKLAGSFLHDFNKAGKSAGQVQLFNNLSKEHQRVSDEIKDAEKELNGLSESWQGLRGVMGATNKTHEIKDKLDKLRKQQDMIIKQMGNLTDTPTEETNDNNSSNGRESVTDNSGDSSFDSFFSGLLSGDEDTSGDQ